MRTSTLTLAPVSASTKWEGNARWPYATVRPFRISDLPNGRPAWGRPVREARPYFSHCTRGQTPVYAASLQTSLSARLAYLTKPGEDSFPYIIKPKGWTRKGDPFAAEAARRLAEVEAGTRPAWW